MTKPTPRSLRASALALAAVSVAALTLASCGGGSTTTASTTPGVSTACSNAVNGVKHFISTHPASAGPIDGKTVLAYQGLYKKVTTNCPATEINKLTTQTIQPWIKSIKPAK